MDTISNKANSDKHNISRLNFTVFFESPFWVGVFERRDGEGYSVCRVVFGSEPTDTIVNELSVANFGTLRFSEAVAEDRAPIEDYKNPKRLHRESQKAIERQGISTKAEEALKQQLEHKKKERKVKTKEMKEEEAARQYELRQQKQKKKKRGH